MSVQDKVERVLREFYVLYSRSEPYDKNAERVIVNKKEAFCRRVILTIIRSARGWDKPLRQNLRFCHLPC